MGRSFFRKTLEERRKERCPRCELRLPLCFCDRIPRLELKTRVIVLMHVAERNLTTNTARLATLALPNSELRVRGLKGEPSSPEGLAQPGGESLVLYPSDDARVLTPELAGGLKRPVTLIVPDGSWRQARRAANREPGIRDLPRVVLPPGPPSEYRLRTEPDEASVSTFEAIARALGVLEGPEAQARLEELFRIRVGRTLWARGMIRPEECPGGIPEAALLEAARAGMSKERRAELEAGEEEGEGQDDE